MISGYHKNLVFTAACIGMCFFGVSMITLGSVLPSLVTKLELSGLQTTSLVTFLPIGMLAGSLIFGPIADRFGHKALLVPSCIIVLSGLEGLIFFESIPLLQISIVGIGLGGGAGGVLGGQRVLNVQPGGQRVVPVDNGQRAGVAVRELCGNGLGLHGGDVVAMIVNDVERGHAVGRVRAVGKGDETLLREQEQGARLVAVVGRNNDGRALLDLIQRGHAVAVEAERRIVNLRGNDQIGAVGSVVAVEIGGVLEVVGVELAVGKRLVRKDVIVIDDDLQLVALGGQRVLDLLEDLGVRGGAGADGDDLVVGSGGGGIAVGAFGGLSLGAAARDAGAQQRKRENKSNQLFHVFYLLL